MITVENVLTGSQFLTNVLTISSFTVTSANKLFVLIGTGMNGSARTVSSVTFGSDTLSFVGSQDTTADFERVEIWEKTDPTVQTANVVVTCNGTCQIGASAIGLIGAGTDGTIYGGEGTTADPSVTVVDSANGDLVLGVYMSDLGPDGTTTENGTLIGEVENISGDSDFSSQRYDATGSNTVVSWTAAFTSPSKWAIAAFAVKPASAPTKHLLLMRTQNTF